MPDCVFPILQSERLRLFISFRGWVFCPPPPLPHPVPTTGFRSCQIKSVPAPSPGWHGGQQLTGMKPGSEYPTACPMLGHAWEVGGGEGQESAAGPGQCLAEKLGLLQVA